MIPGQTCQTCAAFSPLSNECRRKSPMAIMIQRSDGQHGALGVYPGTNKDGWCREWEQQPAEKNNAEWTTA